MAKKLFVSPFVVLSGLTPGSGDVIGGGSGQSTTDIDDIPWDYETWCVVAADFPAIYDYDGDGEGGTTADYEAWMGDHGYDPIY